MEAGFVTFVTSKPAKTLVSRTRKKQETCQKTQCDDDETSNEIPNTFQGCDEKHGRMSQ
jgi:hypothetical protein